MTNYAKHPDTARCRAPHLEKIVHYWQKMLRLQDWDIIVYEVPQFELQEPDTLAECHVFPAPHSCYIYILDEKTREAKRRVDDGTRFHQMPTTETLLVHEMLHIWTELMGMSDFNDRHHSKEHIAMEQMVNSISEALVNLRHSQADVKDGTTFREISDILSAKP